LIFLPEISFYFPPKLFFIAKTVFLPIPMGKGEIKNKLKGTGGPI